MVTSYHSHKDKQKLQGKSGTENRCCDTLVWGYFSPQETGMLSFMWWRQDVHLALPLCSLITSPYLPPFKATVSPSPGSHVQLCLWNWERGNSRRPQNCTAARNGVPSKAPPAPPQTSTARALLYAHALGSALGRHEGHVWPGSAQWPDVTPAPLAKPLSPAWRGAAAGRHSGILYNTFKLFGEYSTRWSQVLLNTALACRCCVSLESPCPFSSKTNHRSP